MRNFKNTFLSIVLLFPMVIFAQLTIKGKVTDKLTKSALPGVDVVIKGTTKGTTTDFDGLYTIKNVNTGDVLVFSFVGYGNVEVTVTSDADINVSLEESVESLEEVVLIGYGATTKQDATGAVQKVSTKEFNKGAVVSPEQLLAGKSAGVRITTNGGAPGEGSEIRIRGGASLTANNAPLIVVDGLPLDQRGVQGVRNQLNAINPNEIENFVVLKDASATAIYGSRASNGVILITTKKGKINSPFSVEYDVKVSLAEVIDKVDILNAAQFRSIVENTPGADTSFLGNTVTNWQDKIYRDASGVIHNLTFSQGFKNFRYRINLNNTSQNGILKKDFYQRNAININLSQNLFDNHLKLTVTAKGIQDKNRFANRDAIGAAVQFDPTQAVLDPTSIFGGFFEFLDNNGEASPNAPRNPLSILEFDNNKAKNERSITNFIADYKFHFLPELRLNVTAGLDYSELDGKQFIDLRSATVTSTTETRNIYGGLNRNTLLDFYLNYKKKLESFNTTVDVTAGHSYQEFYVSSNREVTINSVDQVLPIIINRNSLESYFGRASFDIADKYLISASFRRDGSSRFNPDGRWGNFPAASIGWKVSNEEFLKDSKFISNLKLRAGWGITGQNEIDSNYGYLGIYTPGENSARVQFGNGFENTLRPEEFDENLRWEETEQYNAGLEIGFFDNRINATVDAYYRETKDLLAKVPTPAGSNLSDLLITNVGNTVSRGIEFGINNKILKSQNLNWDLNFNVTFQDVEITKISLGDDPNFFIPQGGISGGVGNKIQIWKEGYDPTTFFVFRQVYDTSGNPIEGAYVDVNGDNQITEADRVPYKKATPDAFVGLTSNFNYKNLDFSFTFRGGFGNYNYNNVKSNTGYFDAITNTPGNYFANASDDVLQSNFKSNQLFSDYYIDRADYVKLDNVSLGYLVPGEKVSFRVSLTATNVLTITDYDGLDPEISNGIDNNFYPRPRTYVLGLNFTF